MRRALIGKKKKLFIQRFYPAGTYNWPVPPGCTEIDVFLVGAGAGGGNGYGVYGGGSGYTKTYKKSNTSSGSYNSWVKDGDAIRVTPGQQIKIVVGKGGLGGVNTSGRNPRYGEDGGATSVVVGNTTYIAEGGKAFKGETDSTGKQILPSGGVACSAAGGWGPAADASYSDGQQPPERSGVILGTSQGHTTRDFGEIEFEPNAGGTSGGKGGYGTKKYEPLRSTGHTEGSGQDGSSYSGYDTYAESEGGAGYGGAGGVGGCHETSGRPHGSGKGGDGGDGTVVIRYWA
ncbi:hypothetical protein H8784_19735 [Parabacteroides acidifaciens]|uniref:Glycine-rich domain-containing protein n=2 Tax=Parabacteroides acidifaciens TaxID=2290935 RepID=A0ABR7P6S2_9BACT|nr:hypothetical protein [Parabacteroides acidifaciens]